MFTNRAEIPPPSDDKRWRIVQTTMRRNGFKRHGLIETLHSVQEAFGYLDEPSLRYVAHALALPLSQVYGVSTFYHLFTLKPAGEHTCVICTGTACYIKHGNALLAAVKESLDIEPEKTTADDKVSLLTARCIGACGIAPVVVLDDEVFGHVTIEQLQAALNAWTALPAGGLTEGGLTDGEKENTHA